MPPQSLLALQVYAISTEDMDSLTFASPRLIRHLMAPASQKLAIMEYDYAQVGERGIGGGAAAAAPWSWGGGGGPGGG